MSTKYQLLFSPELKDSSSELFLVPVIVSENGDRFAMQKSVKTVRQALLFDAGFTLAQFIEEEGGFDGVKAILETRGEDAARKRGADTLTQQEEDDLLDALDDGPLALTEQEEADLEAGLDDDTKAGC